MPPTAPHAQAAPPTPAAARWRDLGAGLCVAGLLLPEAVAYAGIAGLPPAAGLVGAIAGLGSYALLGTSRHGIVAATSSSTVDRRAAAFPDNRRWSFRTTPSMRAGA